MAEDWLAEIVNADSPERQSAMAGLSAGMQLTFRTFASGSVEIDGPAGTLGDLQPADARRLKQNVDAGAPVIVVVAGASGRAPRKVEIRIITGTAGAARRTTQGTPGPAPKSAPIAPQPRRHGPAVAVVVIAAGLAFLGALDFVFVEGTRRSIAPAAPPPAARVRTVSTVSTVESGAAIQARAQGLFQIAKAAIAVRVESNEEISYRAVTTNGDASEICGEVDAHDGLPGIKGATGFAALVTEDGVAVYLEGVDGDYALRQAGCLEPEPVRALPL